jgi:hypothetical protein
MHDVRKLTLAFDTHCYYIDWVLISASEVSIRWTGHMFAISKSLERCSVVKDPAKVNIALDPVGLAAMGDRSQSE